MTKTLSDPHRLNENENLTICNGQGMLFYFVISLTRFTTSSERKLFRFDKKKGQRFEIVSIDVTFYFYNVCKLVFNLLLKMILIGGLRINPYPAK